MLFNGRVIRNDELSVFATNISGLVALEGAEANRVPAEAALLWQHSMRISRRAGERTLEKDMAVRKKAEADATNWLTLTRA